tara:strand:- start:355 stop:861 length:507 start_codon:yes stop_codon:yes gene_type:complete
VPPAPAASRSLAARANFLNVKLRDSNLEDVARQLAEQVDDRFKMWLTVMSLINGAALMGLWAVIHHVNKSLHSRLNREIDIVHKRIAKYAGELEDQHDHIHEAKNAGTVRMARIREDMARHYVTRESFGAMVVDVQAKVGQIAKQQSKMTADFARLQGRIETWMESDS